MACHPRCRRWRPGTSCSLVAGLIAGYSIGSLPGLSSSIGIALLIPFTFAMRPVDSIVMLVTLYVATEYAGAIPAILVNTPGIPAAAITALDGYPMRLRGEAGAALTLSILSAGFGSILSTLLLIVTSTSLAKVALAFGPTEYFAVAVLGLSLVSSLSGHSMLKGFVGLFFGLGIELIGTDPIDGVTRYVFTDSLLSGVGFLPALIGLFALSSIFTMIEELFQPTVPLDKLPNVFGQFGLMKPHFWTLVRSTLIGYLVSVVPGHGATISAVVSYTFQKRMSKNPKTFGTGNPEGVVASETGANASVAGALAPMLALGIPGLASTAVLIGALTLHGVQPGPLLFVKNPEIRIFDFHRHDRDHALHGRARSRRRASVGARDASSERHYCAACHRALPTRQLRFAERYICNVDDGILWHRRLYFKENRYSAGANRAGADSRVSHRDELSSRPDRFLGRSHDVPHVAD